MFVTWIAEVPAALDAAGRHVDDSGAGIGLPRSRLGYCVERETGKNLISVALCLRRSRGRP